jgi:hypothetical protein
MWPKVAAAIALGDAHAFAARMADCIEQGPGGDADGFDHERVALPGTDRVSRPVRIGIRRKTAAVGMDLA